MGRSAEPFGHNAGVNVEAEIDALYRLPLQDFVAARNALAKSVTGTERTRVRSLEKPTVAAWAVNQLYWRDRKTFEQLVRAGTALRDAQLAVLKGRSADVRAAGGGHRTAIADAVQRTIAVTRAEGQSIDADAITKTLEALSLGSDAIPGRLIKPLQPAGFEALAGVKVAARPVPAKEHHERPGSSSEPKTAAKAESEHPAASRRAEAARRAAEKRDAATRRALERAVERARQDEARARRRLEEAQKKLADAELRLRDR